MYKTEAEAEEYIQALLPRVSAIDGVDVAICVPFTDLRAMVDSARGSRVEVYAQNMHSEPEGAYTGEISAPMLCELDVQGVVLGHSERRELFGETDRALAPRFPPRWPPASHRSCAWGRPSPSATTAIPSASCASRSAMASPRLRTSASQT